MKKITNFITLKFISILLISLLILMSAVQVSSMLKIRSDILKIEKRWDEVQIEQSEKLRLENAIHSFLGLGGMIHNFKSSIINKNIKGYQEIQSNLRSAETVIQLYLRFQLSKAERYALHDILEVIQEYQYKIEYLPSLLTDAISLQELDQYLNVDDEPALQGLEIINQYNRQHAIHLHSDNDFSHEQLDNDKVFNQHINSASHRDSNPTQEAHADVTAEKHNGEHDNHSEEHETPEHHQEEYGTIDNHNDPHDHDSHNDQPHTSDKFVQLTDLMATLGYGGVIHHVKNYQIRSDDISAHTAQHKLDESGKQIKKFEKIVTTTHEQLALQKLQNLVDNYQKHLNNLKLGINQAKKGELLKLEQSEADALQALQVLHKRIELELRFKVTEVDQRIHAIQTNINSLISLIVSVTIATILLMSYILFNRIISPLQKVTTSMVMLARQKHKSRAGFNAPHIFEIKQMFRSIRIFKKYEDKRRITELSLTKMHGTTLEQLSEIKNLQHKSEQKTEQALSLANHLIELQRSAEADRNHALESERRISTILNTVHDAIISTDVNGIITSINTTTETMLLYRESEILGKNITLLMSSKNAKKFQNSINKLNNKQQLGEDNNALEMLIQRADDTAFPAEIFFGKSELNGEVTYTNVVRDITQRKKDEEAIQHLILSDPLTNLANRRHFNQELTRSLDNQKRHQLSMALLMIDLDNFKPVNDTYGHHVGDKVLQRVASRLGNIIRSVDLISRLGGDEFSVILNSIQEPFDAQKTAQKIIDTLSKPIHIDGQTVCIGATVGIALAPQDTTQQKMLINNADKALYKAKSLGKGQYFLYQDFKAD